MCVKCKSVYRLIMKIAFIDCHSPHMLEASQLLAAHILPTSFFSQRKKTVFLRQKFITLF